MELVRASWTGAATRKDQIMRHRLRVLTAASAVAVTAMFAAPTAAADPAQGCTEIAGLDADCSSPENVQINDSPQAVGTQFSTPQETVSPPEQTVSAPEEAANPSGPNAFTPTPVGPPPCRGAEHLC
jgi:hypothetical protein